ncbi:helicase DnaB [Paenibacillus sp. MBLB4367]|uniref:helicase DnaB n=1 Tax=Paenibacillus sp. MBLB4367 TaxID=3384767 RepID=UPI003907FE92
MRMTNMHHFTEHHRFCVYRDFALSGMDYRMLTNIYQPMIGAFAVGVYTTLYQQLAGEKAGFSELEQQRRLFLSLELEPGERGRKFFVEQTSKLEAVGLLQTSRRFMQESEDYIYEYQLAQPLSPNEFFKNQHLTLLLRDKVGKYMVLSLRDHLIAEEPEELAASQAEQLSVPFYDLFRLNTQVIDYELEQALYQTAPARQTKAALDVTSKGFDYSEIIMRFPRGSRNRVCVEALKFRTDQLAAVNIVAKKYHLSLQETCRLLDEDGVFDEEGELQIDLMQYKANLFFRQDKRRDEQAERYVRKMEAIDGGRSSAMASSTEGEPSSETNPDEAERTVEMAFYLEVPTIFQGQCNVHQYNMLLRNEPYTLVLKRYFAQGSVPDGVLDIFEKIDLNYKLHEEVINVLIHFIHADRRSWAKSSIEAVASDMLGKQIVSYEQAVDYIREKMRFREQAAARAAQEKDRRPGYSQRGTRGGGKQKPQIPMVANEPNDTPVTQEELEEIRRKAQRLERNRS